jgi:hypothetical protein
MIKQWVGKKLLFVDDYENPLRRKEEKGLFVDDSKRPRQREPANEEQEEED